MRHGFETSLTLVLPRKRSQVGQERLRGGARSRGFRFTADRQIYSVLLATFIALLCRHKSLFVMVYNTKTEITSVKSWPICWFTGNLIRFITKRVLSLQWFLRYFLVLDQNFESSYGAFQILFAHQALAFSPWNYQQHRLVLAVCASPSNKATLELL